jgi:uncharacterized protein
MEVEILSSVEVRVLGALLEKDIATPEYYPLTLNSLQNACNQKSSRDPVVNYDESAVAQALEILQHKGLVVRISGAGHRVEKWAHRLGEKLNLGRRELALLCVLMLRGPQTVGELRGRTERMHDFADMDEVERLLETLAGREEPLVAPAARGRWVQTFSGQHAVEEPIEPTRSEKHYGDNGESGFDQLRQRVGILESEVQQLREEMDRLRRQLEPLL